MISVRFPTILIAVISLISCTKEVYQEKESSPAPIASLAKEKATYPLSLADSFVWGINGHPLTQEAYRNNISEQLELVKQMGMSYYRVDISIDTNGIVNDTPQMNELLQTAAAKNIRILPMVYLRGWEQSVNEADAFRRGRKIGNTFAAAYSSVFDYYEMGNEEERKILQKGNGDQITDYDIPRFTLLGAFQKGMHEGIKAADPSAQTIICNSGWLHYGYFQLLQDYKIPYDILGLHWYSDMGDLNNAKGHGDIISIISSFQKPIWITEINRRDGSWDGSAPNADASQQEWMERYVQQLHQRLNVKAFFVYELFDQPVYADKSKNHYNPSESCYGVIRWVNAYATYALKPAFTALQYRIEEINYGYEDFLRAVYHKLYDKEPDSQWLTYWLAQLKSGKTKNDVIQSLQQQHAFAADLFSLLQGDAFWKDAIAWGYAKR